MTNNKTYSLLLVEDELSLQNLLRLSLEAEGYEVTIASNGAEALDTFEHTSFDLILLDVMLPNVNGFEVCERIRLQDSQTPILFLTARGESDDRIKGLQMGADDYLAKPFVLQELLLRIQRLLERTQPDQSNIHTYQFGQNQVNFDTHEAIGIQGPLTLTKIEVKLLKMFIDHKNQVLSRKQILHTVWGYDVYPETRTIDNFILNFRRYFEHNSRQPEFFKSVRGVGYRFVSED